MRTLIVAALLSVGTTAAVQAQGGRRGGSPDMPGAHGTMCIDMDSVVKVEVVKGAAAVAAYGQDAANGIIIVYAKPGPGVRNCTAPSSGGDDALGKLLLSPDLVISHQQAIGLSEQQQKALRSMIFDTQLGLLDHQMTLNGEVEKLQSLLKSAKPDEGKVLEEMDKVLGLERDMKRLQLSLMVKLKNSLTQQQQAQLEAIRKLAPEK